MKKQLLVITIFISVGIIYAKNTDFSSKMPEGVIETGDYSQDVLSQQGARIYFLNA